MRKMLLILSLGCIYTSLWAQSLTLERDVSANAGEIDQHPSANTNQSNYLIDWTLGEPFINDYFNTNGKIRVTEGFHQPRVLSSPNFVINFPPFVSGSTIDSLKDEYKEIGAIRTDSCNCGKVEIWKFPTNIEVIESDSTVRRYIGDEEIWKYAKRRATIRDTLIKVDHNRVLNIGLVPNTANGWKPELFPGLDPVNSVKIAIIDFGVDGNHTTIQPMVWQNPTPSTSMDTSDCFDDDYNGYRWVKGIEDNKAMVDNLGHGTHIAGIFALMFPNMPAEIMSLRIGKGNDDESRVFELACAMRYAIDKKVDVINISLGYHGPESSLLRSLFLEAQDEGILIVASAGNENSNNDSFGHWPSNFPFENVISVGAYDNHTEALAYFSNYGVKSVHIAADGVNIYSTLPNQNFGYKSGTSISSALVSAVLAAIISDDPNLSYIGAKQKLLNPPFIDYDPALIGFIQQERKLAITMLDCGIEPEARDDKVLAVTDSIMKINVRNNDCYQDGILPELDLSVPALQGNVWVDSLTGEVLYQTSDTSGTDMFGYILCSLDANGTCDTAVVEIEISKLPVSIDEVVDLRFNIYPNPNKGIVNVDFSVKEQGLADLKIINVSGQEVFTWTSDYIFHEGSHSLTFDLSRLSYGMYFVQFSVGSVQQTKKILKN